MMNFAGVPVTIQQMQRRAFHVCPVPLRPGSIIDPGNFGRIIRHFGTDHTLHPREELLEHIRATEFPGKPSRLTSAFCCPDYENAEWFRRNHSPTGIIYLVVPSDIMAAEHIGAMNCLKGKSDEDAARHYWRGDLMVTGPDGFRAQEIVTSSPLLVIQNMSQVVVVQANGVEPMVQV